MISTQQRPASGSRRAVAAAPRPSITPSVHARFIAQVSGSVLGGEGVVRAVAKGHGPGRVDVRLETGVAQDPDEIGPVVLSTCAGRGSTDARPSRLPCPAGGQTEVTALMPADPRNAPRALAIRRAATS